VTDLVVQLQDPACRSTGLVSCTAQEPSRTGVTCCDVCAFFADVGRTLLAFITPRQFLYMDETGASARPFKRKRKKIAYILRRPISPRSQDVRDVSRLSCRYRFLGPQFAHSTATDRL
jgi:hypothetical protein